MWLSGAAAPTGGFGPAFGGVAATAITPDVIVIINFAHFSS